MYVLFFFIITVWIYCDDVFFFRRFDELVKRFNVEYHAGGATQNSIKIAQVCHIYTYFSPNWLHE